jgi:hypothetical protein
MDKQELLKLIDLAATGNGYNLISQVKQLKKYQKRSHLGDRLLMRSPENHGL